MTAAPPASEGDPRQARTILVTGAASGMGAATATRLRGAGDRVIGLDRNDPGDGGIDVVADLSTAEGRRQAVAAVREACGGRLDGAVLAAGLGPVPGRERLIAEVNVAGAVDLLVGLRPALAAAGDAKVVVLGSNSTTTTPLVPRRAVAHLRDGDVEAALRRLRRPRATYAAFTYAASKLAVTHWVRTAATTPDWAGAGIRLNVLAPGAVRTPLLEEQLAGPDARRIRAFPVPIGQYGEPDQVARWAELMLSSAADSLVGSVVVVDGGSEAWFRATDWPRPVPARRLPAYLLGMRRWSSQRRRARRE